jgi:Yip1 domain
MRGKYLHPLTIVEHREEYNFAKNLSREKQMTDEPLSQGRRVVDAFVAPSKTFTDILRNQSWWLPFLLGALVSYGYLFSVEKQIGWHTLVQNTLRQDPKASERLANASPEEHARAEAFTQTLIKGIFYVSPLLGLLTAAIAAAILWGTLNGIFAGKATFGQVFAVWMYGTLPLLVKPILVNHRALCRVR